MCIKVKNIILSTDLSWSGELASHKEIWELKFWALERICSDKGLILKTWALETLYILQSIYPINLADQTKYRARFLIACEQAPRWCICRREKLASQVRGAKSQGEKEREPPVHTPLAWLADFCLCPISHLGACSLASFLVITLEAPTLLFSLLSGM